VRHGEKKVDCKNKSILFFYILFSLFSFPEVRTRLHGTHIYICVYMSYVQQGGQGKSDSKQKAKGGGFKRMMRG